MVQQPITADLKYYNANTRDSDTGDCVKRGLSVAYSMDYDAVSSELNRIKRDLGYSQFNIGPVFQTFMSRRGDDFITVPESEQVSADEFCNQNPKGVYVVLVGKSISSHSSHLAAIVDGTLFDSWNSLDWYVKKYSKISQGKSEVYDIDRLTGLDAAKEVAAAIDEYIKNNLSKKIPNCMQIYLEPSVEQDDKYTYEIFITCKFGDVPDYSRWRSNSRIGHKIIMKFNPRMPMEENITSLIKKCKQKAYDWVYNTKAEILDAEKLERIGVNRHFYTNERGNGTILGKLPEWAIPLIERIWDNGDYGDRYEVDMEALPDDPRYEDNREVTFYANSLKELKDQLEWYKADYSRINYDY